MKIIETIRKWPWTDISLIGGIAVLAILFVGHFILKII